MDNNVVKKNFDLDEYIKIINGTFDTQNSQIDYEQKINLNSIRNQNYKDYYDINILKLENLPNEFEDVVNDIVRLYNSISKDNLLIEPAKLVYQHREILDEINRKYKRLDMMVKTKLEELELDNNSRQSKLSITYIKSRVSNFNLKSRILNLYNDLILYNAELIKDNYEDLKRQIVRKQYIDCIFELLNLDKYKQSNEAFKNELLHLNLEIKNKVEEYDNKICYLEDLIDSSSKYKDEFTEFVNFYNKIKVYDNENYENAKQTYEILSDNSMFASKITFFENKFIEEIENNKKEEKFIHDKVGEKNIKKSLDFISANYIDTLDMESKKQIEDIYKKLNSNFDISEIEKRIFKIVNKIWIENLTNIYSYNPDDNFCFICSNNQFMDPKQEAILITKNELENNLDFSDYQIGFICNYDNNILYITENDDIMTVDYNDMSKLKTPKQLEQEFVNFNVCNKIALNGYITKIGAVYYIDDNNKTKYLKALSLANDYKLPLIVLKK